MVTTRASGIRFGVVRPWPVKSAELGFFYSNFDSKIRIFFSDFFSQSILLGMGVALSGVLLRRWGQQLLVDVFLQDSRLLDWLATRPGFVLKRLPRRRSFKKRFAFSRKTFFKYRGVGSSGFSMLKFYRALGSSRKFFLRKKVRAFSKLRYFRRRRKYFQLRRARKLSRYFKLRAIARRAFRRKYPAAALVRFKRRRVRSRFSYSFRKSKKFRRQRAVRIFARPNFKVATRFFCNFQRFCRFRFFKFFSRFASSLAYKCLGIPVFFRLNFIGRVGSAQFYLNYITTKLYYRYILSDVINPIVRISLKYYRGFRIICRGRFTRAQMATERLYRRGALRLSSMRAPIDYAQKSVVLKYGTCNLKIWLRY